jgi:hypothetical protein
MRYYITEYNAPVPFQVRAVTTDEVIATCRSRADAGKVAGALNRNGGRLADAARAVLDRVEAEGRDTGLGDAFSDLRDALDQQED